MLKFSLKYILGCWICGVYFTSGLYVWEEISRTRYLRKVVTHSSSERLRYFKIFVLAQTQTLECLNHCNYSLHVHGSVITLERFLGGNRIILKPRLLLRKCARSFLYNLTLLVSDCLEFEDGCVGIRNQILVSESRKRGGKILRKWEEVCGMAAVLHEIQELGPSPAAKCRICCGRDGFLTIMILYGLKLVAPFSFDISPL